ncbi:MAG: ABC transporter permease [Leifsonia sp.]|nr:ABC transporter permease [Leifsonia sp.]|tara:strand:- start:56774 stop:57640 length:867 start_codon:yes stop_codon:yes gene_type:complete
MTAPKTTAIALGPTLRAGRVGSVGLVVTGGILAIALVLAGFGSLLAPDALVQDILLGVTPPGTPGHPLGTDELGRDILQLLIAGSGSALAGPVVIALGSMLLGVIFGTVTGYVQGWLDFTIGRVTDLLLALPVVVVAIVVAGVFGSGYWVTVAMLVVLFAPSDIRLVRSAVIEQSARPYIESARMLRLGPLRIMFRHILPNVSPIIVTNALVNFAIAIVALSSLSFLGVGVSPGAADWGRQLDDGRGLLPINPAATIAPAIAIVVVACAANLLGDALAARAERKGGAE